VPYEREFLLLIKEGAKDKFVATFFFFITISLEFCGAKSLEMRKIPY